MRILNKITFEKRLGIDSKQRRWLGLKIIIISFLVALAGGLIVLLGVRDIGRLIVILAFFSIFIGSLLYIVAFVSLRGNFKPENKHEFW